MVHPKAVKLTATDAIRARLAAQLLADDAAASDPTTVIEHLVAMQGQDLPAVRRAIAMRSGGAHAIDEAALTAVDGAFDGGQLVRGWPMRGTLFATTPANLGAFLSLTADRIRPAMAKRRGNLGLTDEIVERAAAILVELVDAAPRTRAEVLAAWEADGITVAGGPGYHLIVWCSIGGLVHWGPMADGEQLLVRSDHGDPPDPHEALVAIVEGYLASHAPASVDDIAWWTKLPKGQIRKALATLDDAVVEVDVDGRTMLLPAAALDARDGWPELDGSVVLVPAFDEWYLGYQDRTLVSSAETDAAIVPGKNGVFRPLILIDGTVVGTWRVQRGRAEVRDVVDGLSKPRRAAIDDEIDRLNA